MPWNSTNIELVVVDGGQPHSSDAIVLGPFDDGTAIFGDVAAQSAQTDGSLVIFFTVLLSGDVTAQNASVDGEAYWSRNLFGIVTALPAESLGSIEVTITLSGDVFATKAGIDSVVEVLPFPSGQLRPVLNPSQTKLDGIDCGPDDKVWAVRGCPAFRTIANLVSPPYPILNMESVTGIGPSIDRGALRKASYWESVDTMSVDILSGHLAAILQVYTDFPWESVNNMSVDILGGELNTILKYYENYHAESADTITPDILSGELRQILIERTLPWESVDTISVTIVSGELQ